jgi:choline dehydrogenase-like flavoprotein
MQLTKSDLADAIHRGAPDRLERPGTFDAIVIGAGAAGGLAAERLTQAGLKVLVLDAGFRPSFFHSPFRRFVAEAVSRAANPNFLPFMPPSLLQKGRWALRKAGRVRQGIQTQCYAWERRPDAFVDDLDCPYTTPPDRPFLWIRARALQGRVGIPGHGRLYFRLGHDDFAPPDGLSPVWPFALNEMDPWYSDVEKRLGIAGAQDGLPWLPDSEIKHALTPTAAEAALMGQVKARWPQFRPVLGRYAPPANTLVGAAHTGRLTLRQGAIAREVDVKNGKVTGVQWFDQASHSIRKAQAPLVFLCASALESTRILMLSQDAATERAIGSQSDALGHYLMDHIILHAEGSGAALPGEATVKMEDGRCVYLPRFDARDDGAPQPGRGFGVQIYQVDMGQSRSYFGAAAFSEMLPRHENRVTLNRQQLDRWGIPILHIDCSHGTQDLARIADETKALRALADAAGIALSRIDERASPPGHAVHECGTARMGNDPATSVLDPHNQCWDAAGLYVTDSASFPSQGSQNPTLTVMALTARACAHALQSAAPQDAS